MLQLLTPFAFCSAISETSTNGTLFLHPFSVGDVPFMCIRIFPLGCRTWLKGTTHPPSGLVSLTGMQASELRGALKDLAPALTDKQTNLVSESERWVCMRVLLHDRPRKFSLLLLPITGGRHVLWQRIQVD